MPHEVIIIGGPNGAGKSTLAYEFVDHHGHTYLSADHIAAKLDPEQPARAKMQAGKLFFKRMSTLIDSRASFIVESTLAGKGIGRLIDDLQKAGYTIRLAFVFVDSPDLCVRRVRERVLQGGHDVPEQDIVRRFYRSKRNFWHVYRGKVDRWYLFYNGSESFQEVAVGRQAEYSVSDEALFEQFIQDVSE